MGFTHRWCIAPHSGLVRVFMIDFDMHVSLFRADVLRLLAFDGRWYIAPHSGLVRVFMVYFDVHVSPFRAEIQRLKCRRRAVPIVEILCPIWGWLACSLQTSYLSPERAIFVNTG
jgi:hypothetical protein